MIVLVVPRGNPTATTPRRRLHVDRRRRRRAASPIACLVPKLPRAGSRTTPSCAPRPPTGSTPGTSASSRRRSSSSASRRASTPTTAGSPTRSTSPSHQGHARRSTASRGMSTTTATSGDDNGNVDYALVTHVRRQHLRPVRHGRRHASSARWRRRSPTRSDALGGAEVDAHRHAPARSGTRCCAATSASSPASRSIRTRMSSAARRSPAARRRVAAIFGCSDSRLAAEIIFDLGLGDAFVVRNAGQVISESVLGSLEYAVDVLQRPAHPGARPRRVRRGARRHRLAGGRCRPAPAAHRAAHRPDRPRRPPRRRPRRQPIDPADGRRRRGGPRAPARHRRRAARAAPRSSALRSPRVRLAIVGANYRLAEGRAVPDVVVGRLTAD